MEIMFSIVVAAYNAERYLKQHIESLLAQTFSDFEVIFVNDGSTDQTLAILKSYGEHDNRIKIYTQENQGAGVARNVGISHARGKYLLILDADDFFCKDMLEVLVKQAEEKQTDILIFKNWEFDDATGEVKECGFSVNEELFPQKETFSIDDFSDCVFQSDSSCAWNKVYCRDFIEKNKIEFQVIRQIDDAFFERTALVKAGRIGFCPDRLLYYRVNNPNSQIADFACMAENMFLAFTALKRYFIEQGVYKKIKMSFARRVYDQFLFALLGNKDFETFQRVYEAIKRVYLPGLTLAEIGEEIPYSAKLYSVYNNMKEMDAQQFIYEYYYKYNLMKFYCSFPSQYIKTSDKVILYGAGNIGKNYYSQNIMARYCTVVAWVDKKFAVYKERGLDVQSIEVIKNKRFDYILIAVEFEKIAGKIKQELMELGVKEDKIRWYQPMGL